MSSISALFAKKQVRQIISLLLSTILSVGVGILVSIVNTRLLGPAHYGDLKFIHNILNFLATIATMGVFYSGGRLLTKKEQQENRPGLIAALLISAVILGIVWGAILILISVFQGNLFNNDLDGLVRLSCPLLFLFILQTCLLNVMQGDNRIYQLSWFKVAPQALYFLVLVALDVFFALTLVDLLLIQMTTTGLVSAYFVHSLAPRFKNWKKAVSCILDENRAFGIQVYYGTLAGVASAYLGGISIGYYVDNEHVGYYSLAVMMTSPLMMVPNVVGTVFFKEFAHRKSIPVKVTLLTILISIASLITFCYVCRDLVILLFTKSYLSVVPLAYIIATGYMFHGFGDYLNRFLGSHGDGKGMRNASFYVGLTNLAGFGLLVPAFGVKGGAYTTMAAGVVYALSSYYYYSKYLRNGV